MVAGEWVKTFGGTSKTTYYHILAIEEERRVVFEIYDYYPVYRKVLGRGRKDVTVKWWMEQILAGALHEVPRHTVPFLLTV